MGRLDKKVAIVTGGARGLGEAVVRQFVAEGAHVVLTDILVGEGEALARELGQAAAFFRHDVRSEADWNQVIERTESQFGPVSVLVNNAGISQLNAIADVSEAEYRKVIDVNQIGVFLGLKMILASMQRAGGGAIINFSSVAGMVGTRHAISYTASKYAVRGMTKVAAIEYGPLNIRVNSIHPGPFKTPMTVDETGAVPDVVQESMGALPAGRFGEPAELAHMVLLLASDEMRFATGAEFVIDGGWSCQ